MNRNEYPRRQEPRRLTLGKIVGIDSHSGVVLTSYIEGPEGLETPVCDMDLAEQGIDIRYGERFIAEINTAAITPGNVKPDNFTAVNQQNPGETLGGVFAQE